MTGEDAEKVGRRIALHLRGNNFEACHSILTDLEEEQSKKRAETPMAIAELNIELRHVNALEKAGYLYVTDLEGVNLYRLNVPQIGALTRRRIQQVVNKALERIREKQVQAEV